jgi:hypothetical protein
MSPQQLDIAAHSISDIVREACSGKEAPSAEKLKKLAEDAADALIAGFKKLNGAT